MPDDINREISAVLERNFKAIVAAVMGSGANTRYNAVTTYASMFGDRNAFMNRLEIDSDMDTSLPDGRPARVSLHIYYYTGDKLAGNFRSHAESHQKSVKDAVAMNERLRQSAAAAALSRHKRVIVYCP